jgi:hypothetical protein
MMARLPSLTRIVTLQACLEAIIPLREAYLVAEAGEDWRPRHLLVWLEEHHPDLLSLPVALVPPDPNEEGTIFAVDPDGTPFTGVPLYHLERRPIDFPI